MFRRSPPLPVAVGDAHAVRLRGTVRRRIELADDAGESVVAELERVVAHEHDLTAIARSSSKPGHDLFYVARDLRVCCPPLGWARAAVGRGALAMEQVMGADHQRHEPRLR